MGGCLSQLLSLCQNERDKSLQNQISAIEVTEKSNPVTDATLKSGAPNKRDRRPLLEGPTLAFHNLRLNESSDSVDDQKNELDALVKAAAAAPKPPPTDSTDSRTFPDVAPGFNIDDIRSSDDSENVA
jgi:hypothetical protein